MSAWDAASKLAWPWRRARRPAGDVRALYRYIWRTSGRGQVVLGALSVGVLLLDLVPLELQRRIVNGALDKKSFSLLAVLCGIYAAVALIQGGAKLALNVYQGAISERANRDLRLRANDAVGHAKAPGEEGVEISIIVSEVEAVGGFVGQSVAELVLHGGVLVTVFGYLVYLQPWMALVAFCLFAPQFLFVPALQEAINRRTLQRIKILRALSVDIVHEAAEQEVTRDARGFRRHVANVYRLNMEIFRRKFGMNFLMNLLHHCGVAGILLVGGWFVVEGKTEVGTVVAFISGLTRINDPWGDLVNYFRDMTNAGVKYRLIARAIDT